MEGETLPMKILHTSDWHLGKLLFTQSMIEFQRAYIEHLIETVQTHSVDVLIVAGDVYDVSVPAHDAIELLEYAFKELTKHCAVIVTSGNHDSPIRLGMNAGLLKENRLHLITRLEDITNPVVLRDTFGDIAFYGIPFLHPAIHHARLSEGTDLEKEKASQATVLKLATDRIEKHAMENSYTRTVVISHAWYNGGVESESERSISIGNLDRVPIDYVARFGYAALGHLHSPQVLKPHVRYCGSPYPYSFGESDLPRHSLLVEYTQTVTVTEIPVPQYKRLISLEDSFENLLLSPSYEEFIDDYVKVTLTDLKPVLDASARLKKRFKNILTVQQPNLLNSLQVKHELSPDLDDKEIFTKYMEYIRANGPTADEQELFEQALENVQSAKYQEKN